MWAERESSSSPNYRLRLHIPCLHFPWKSPGLSSLSFCYVLRGIACTTHFLAGEEKAVQKNLMHDRSSFDPPPVCGCRLCPRLDVWCFCCWRQGVDTGAGMVVFDSPVTVATFVPLSNPKQVRGAFDDRSMSCLFTQVPRAL